MEQVSQRYPNIGTWPIVQISIGSHVAFYGLQVLNWKEWSCYSHFQKYMNSQFVLDLLDLLYETGPWFSANSDFVVGSWLELWICLAPAFWSMLNMFQDRSDVRILGAGVQGWSSSGLGEGVHWTQHLHIKQSSDFGQKQNHHFKVILPTFQFCIFKSINTWELTLPMLWLLSSNAQEC